MKCYFTKHLQMDSQLISEAYCYKISLIINESMYVWVIWSKPGSNNLYLKVPPSIGIGQQCINAFGYHGNGVATTYIPSTGYYTLHYIVLVCILLLNPPTTPKFMPTCIACTHNGWKWTNNSDTGQWLSNLVGLAYGGRSNQGCILVKFIYRTHANITSSWL